MENISLFDREHLWHPYAAMGAPGILEVIGAEGIELELATGEHLIDATSSWWCVAYGHNRPEIVSAIQKQAAKFQQVMFGSFTHQPAAELAERLLNFVPQNLTKVFFADSGSVSVECALKMATQYAFSTGHPARRRFLSVRGGYHGDTTGAMALCDPEGMHGAFSGLLTKHFFAPRPACKFGEVWQSEAFAPMEQLFDTHHDEIAGCILEPVFQGAGGMYFYHPQYLKELRRCCDKYDIPLMFDEIATGFGRVGKTFAAEYAEVEPDIMCVGKALTGGAITLAAVLCSDKIASGISDNPPHALMHGPTFMANPVACAAGCAALDIFSHFDLEQVKAIERTFRQELTISATLPHVREVRTLGAVAVIELDQPVNRMAAAEAARNLGVHLRPFGHVIYAMPPLVTPPESISRIARAMIAAARVAPAEVNDPNA